MTDGPRLGYGTNGFANHPLGDALAVIADLGYTAVALTLDHAHLDPYAGDLACRVDAVRSRLAELGLAVVVETGARYLLDPRRKHHPTLVSPRAEDRDRRVDLLCRAVRVAEDLGADCVSFWSGTAEDTDAAASLTRLDEGVARVLAEAARRGVPLGLEPEPGMVVERLGDALALRARLGDPEPLRITLDVGHCVAVEPESAADCVRRAGPLLVNVQLDDMLPGVHEHLEFGEGELDLADTLGALDEIGYRGVAAVELPRHSHAAPEVAARSMAALRSATWLAGARRRVRERPETIRTLFPAAGRHCGRGPVRPASDPAGVVHGTADDVARVRLLEVLGESGRAGEVVDLYRYGDDAEKRGVLRGLSTVDGMLPVEDGLELVRDALRTNDTRLVAAALGPYAAAHLDDHGWRHGVLKCLFVGVPLAAVAGLAERADEELTRMVTDFAAERRAAGRAVPADAERLLTGASGGTA
ncbi:MAG TPA: EboA domain-containing protein [Pseudonocardiaceae bacterium]